MNNRYEKIRKNQGQTTFNHVRLSNLNDSGPGSGDPGPVSFTNYCMLVMTEVELLYRAGS